MKLISNSVFLEHDTGQHPENKRRLEVIDQVDMIPINLDGSEYLPLVHEQKLIDLVQDAARNAPCWLDGDTMVSSGTYQAAIDAVSCTLIAADLGDFALVRPPGHHSYRDHVSGFCLFNNLAIAVESLRREGKRIFILDFDGHLGDGTLYFFYDTDQVMFWSLHQFPAFPGMGRNSEIGGHRGKGFSVNVPLPPGSSDDIFLHAFKSYFPLIEQFSPDVIAVSAGFDAHRYDPLLQLNLTVDAYYEIGNMLRNQCDRIFAVLEGGYNLEMLPKCVHNFVAGINGIPKPYEEGISTSMRSTWEQYDIDLHLGISYLSPYWKF
ncbi:MAG: histone deacetylase [Saprospiraceae bacterium]|nr:histone deacetylase [Saprospiraceae bacterium]